SNSRLPAGNRIRGSPELERQSFSLQNGWRKGTDSSRRSNRTNPRCAASGDRGINRGTEFTKTRSFEQYLDWHLNFKVAPDPAEHLRRLHGVTSDFKETIVRAHRRQTQCVLPDLRCPGLGGSLRRDIIVVAVESSGIDRRQLARVDFRI